MPAKGYMGTLRTSAQTSLQYPRVSYTDLDMLICKKSEEEVSSDAEGGEHSYAACAPSELDGDVIPVEMVVCRTS